MSETKIISGNRTHQSLRVRLLISHSSRIKTSLLCLLRLYVFENNYLYIYFFILKIYLSTNHLPQVVACTAFLAVVPLLDFVESE